jgi:hypothetical protein
MHVSALTDRPPGPRSTDRFGKAWFQQIARLLYTHNPFYLLSVAFVLHSTRLWLDARAWPYDPWPLMDIVGGYILLVALSAAWWCASAKRGTMPARSY